MHFIFLFSIVDVLLLQIKFKGHILWGFFQDLFFLIGIPVLGLKVNIKFGLYIKKVENNGK